MGRRQGRQKKKWEDNIREWTGLEFAKSQRAAENREKWRKLVGSHLWCPNDPRGSGIGESEEGNILEFSLFEQLLFFYCRINQVLRCCCFYIIFILPNLGNILN